MSEDNVLRLVDNEVDVVLLFPCYTNQILRSIENDM